MINNNYEGDLIFTVIRQHFFTEGNLNPAEIQTKLSAEKIGMDLSVVQNRIDEFKKSRTYRDHNSKA